jgi:cytochrome c
MGGPVYRYDAASSSTHKFPPQFDRRWFIADWTRSWIKIVTLHDGVASDADIEAFPYLDYVHPMDLHFGPDGALYLLDFSQDGDARASPGLYRVEYTGQQPSASEIVAPPALSVEPACTEPAPGGGRPPSPEIELRLSRLLRAWWRALASLFSALAASSSAH